MKQGTAGGVEGAVCPGTQDVFWNSQETHFQQSYLFFFCQRERKKMNGETSQKHDEKQ